MNWRLHCVHMDTGTQNNWPAYGHAAQIPAKIYMILNALFFLTAYFTRVTSMKIWKHTFTIFTTAIFLITLLLGILHQSVSQVTGQKETCQFKDKLFKHSSGHRTAMSWGKFIVIFVLLQKKMQWT